MAAPQRVEAMRLLKGAICLLDDRSELDRHAYDRVLTAVLSEFNGELDKARSQRFFLKLRGVAR